MEQKDSDLEMEVDGTGTFSEDEGEMQCGEESHQVQKEHNQNINEDSRGRSKIDNVYTDEDLSNIFMKLSVKDGLSVSPAECDNNRRINIIADGNHDKYTPPVFSSSSNHDKNLEVLQGKPGDFISGNFKSRSPAIDKRVNVHMNDTNKVSPPYKTTTVDRNKQKQIVITNTIEISKSDCSNTLGKDTDTDGELQVQKIIENLLISYNGHARIDKTTLLLSSSEKSKAGGLYDNDNLTDFPLLLEWKDYIRNSFLSHSSSPSKKVEYDISNEKEDLTSPQKEISNGVSSLQNDTSLALTEKVQGGSNFGNSLQSDKNPALTEKDRGINSLQSSKLLVLGKNINGLKSLNDNSVSARKEIGYDINSLRRKTSSAVEEKDHGVGSPKNYLSSTLKEKEHCVGSHSTSLSPTLKEIGHVVDSHSADLSSTGKEIGQVVDSRGTDLSSTVKEIGQVVDSRGTDLSSTVKEIGHVVDSHSADLSSTVKEIGQVVDSRGTDLSSTVKEIGQAVDSRHTDLSSAVKERGHCGDSGFADSSLTLNERRLYRKAMKHEKTENIVVEVREKEVKHEQPCLCKENYLHTDDEKISQKQKKGRVYKTDFSNINRPYEYKGKEFDVSDTIEYAQGKSYQTREEIIHNRSLDCNPDKELRQSCSKIENQIKSKRKKEWEIRMPHSSNGLDKRHDIKTKHRERYHQSRKDIQVGKIQPWGSESSDTDSDECLFIEENNDKFSVENSAIIGTVYRKLSWKSYLEINQHIGKWDCDRLDPFEQSLARCTFGTQKKEMFYRDFDAHAHHDSGEIRGWNKGEFVFIGELCLGTNEIVEAIPESSIEKGRGELTPEGGAIRKTNEKNTAIKRDEQRNLQRSKSNAENNMKYEGSTESIKRILYGLPPDLITDDETDSSDELKDEVCGIKEELQRQSSVLTRESPDVTAETMPVESYDVATSLVKYLTRCKDFSSDMTRILSKFSLFENIKKFFEEHPDVFSISGNIVELRPKLSICEDFLSSSGCRNRVFCTKLHICDGFIVNICSDSNCIYGHNICTTHNKKALQSFWMENLDTSTIIEVLRLSMLGAVDFQSLDICYDYNFSSCQNYNCKALHICVDYVGGLGSCIRPDCTLNHDIQSHNCVKLLSAYGIDITLLDEEEKLLKVIQDSYEITRFVQDYESKGQTSINFQLNQEQQSSYSKVGPKQEHKLNSVKLSEPLQSNRTLLKNPETMRNLAAIKHSKPVQTTLNASSIVTPSHFKNRPSASQDNHSKGFLINDKSRTHVEGENGSKNIISELPLMIKTKFAYFSSTKDKVNPKNQKNGTNVSTVWSKYPIGDVEIAEICYYSLNTVCKFESSGCQRLHAPMEFHWQMKVSANVSWINLQPHQVFHLEQCYMDPSKEISEFPAPFSEFPPKIVHQILKDEKHFVNFTKLQLINAITFEIYELRRLHVQAKEKSHCFDVFLWYFKDVADKWILYGNVDSSGDRNSASKIRSHDIEKKYLNNEANFLFKNCNGKSSYILDFKKMVQINRDTKSVREVRRRPKPLVSPKSPKSQVTML